MDRLLLFVPGGLYCQLFVQIDKAIMIDKNYH